MKHNAKNLKEARLRMVGQNLIFYPSSGISSSDSQVFYNILVSCLLSLLQFPLQFNESYFPY